jgi:cysteine desulfurase
VEHSSILETLRALAREGFAVTFLPVDSEGRVSAAAVAEALRSDTSLVSIALANNEVGAIQPIHEISCLTKSKGILLHTDAVQAAGKLPMNVSTLGVDLLSLSAHKIYGPKGAGALYLRRGVPLLPLQYGGPQERERRAGTENVAGLVGFGKAARLAGQELEETAARCSQLTGRLWQGLQRNVPGIRLNGPPLRLGSGQVTGRLANTLNVGFPGVGGESLMMGLDLAGVAVSTGSACAAGAVEPSHVILAMGRTAEEAKSAIRFSLGKDTTETEIDTVLEILPGLVERIRRVQGPRGELAGV